MLPSSSPSSVSSRIIIPSLQPRVAPQRHQYDRDEKLVLPEAFKGLNVLGFEHSSSTTTPRRIHDNNKESPSNQNLGTISNKYLDKEYNKINDKVMMTPTQQGSSPCPNIPLEFCDNVITPTKRRRHTTCTSDIYLPNFDEEILPPRTNLLRIRLQQRRTNRRFNIVLDL